VYVTELGFVSDMFIFAGFTQRSEIKEAQELAAIRTARFTPGIGENCFVR